MSTEAKTTIDTLMECIKSILTGPLESHEGKDALTLWISPGDDTLKNLLDAKAGKFSLVIREIPGELASELLKPVPVVQTVGDLAESDMSFFAPPV